MREQRKKLHRRRRLVVGPSFVVKNVQYDGTSDVFANMYRSDNFYEMRGIPRTDLTDDTFGIHDKDMIFSLDKRKRWEIPWRLERDIAELQKPEMNLRISGGIHEVSRAKRLHGFYHYQIAHESYRPYMSMDTNADRTYWINYLPTTGYHDFIDDKEIHKTAEKARLRTLTMKPRPKKKRGPVYTKYGKRKYRCNPREKYSYIYTMLNQEPIQYEKEKQYQPLHLRFSVIELTTPGTSLYNSESRVSNLLPPATKTTKEECKEEKDQRHLDRFTKKRRAFWRNQAYLEHSEDLADIIVDEEPEEFDELFHVPSTSDTFDIMDFVVAKSKKQRHNHQPLARVTSDLFVDVDLESSDSGFSISSCSSSCSASSSSLDQPSTSTAVPEVQKLPEPVRQAPVELLELSPLVELTELRGCFGLPDFGGKAVRLPVFPRTFVVHQRNSSEVLGQLLERCVLVRDAGDGGTAVYELDRCLECSEFYRRKKPNFSEVDFDLCSSLAPSECPVCLDDATPMTSLECGHFFCTTCWLEHSRRILTKGKNPIKCMDLGCSTQLSLSAARALLCSSALSIYRDILERLTLEADFVVSCPKCHVVLPREAGGVAQVQCTACSLSVCATCQNEDHRPLSCDVFRDYTDVLKKNGLLFSIHRARDNRLVSLLTRCPSCSTLMQKSEGCPHMTCNCGAEFCYYCSAAWDSNHYSCEDAKFKEVVLIDHFASSSSIRRRHLTACLEPRLELSLYKKDFLESIKELPRPTRESAERIFMEAIKMVEYTELKRLLLKEKHVNWNSSGRRALHLAFFQLLNIEKKSSGVLERKCQNLYRAIEQARG